MSVDSVSLAAGRHFMHFMSWAQSFNFIASDGLFTPNARCGQVLLVSFYMSPPPSRLPACFGVRFLGVEPLRGPHAP